MTGIRDFVVLFIIIGLIPVSLKRPWHGILGWYWIAYMVPHGLTWGFARTLPVAMIVGGATLVGFILSKDRKPLPRTGTTFFMLASSVHFTLTTILAHNPELAWVKWDRVMKILLMTFVTMALFQDRVRLRWLYMVPALGLGFYGVKGALWAIRTGGGGGSAEFAAVEGGRVFGPEGSFFVDANAIGPALCMILPILLYLSREEERPWLKRIFQVAFGLSIISVIFTFSRGAFLGLAVIVSVLIWRSPWRMRFATSALVVGLLAAPLAPERLWLRISSIADQESAETRDMSTVGRLQSFETAWNIAVNNPLMGAGFWALWNPDVWNMYFGPTYLKAFDAHSIYFEVLSEHGLFGFGLYMGALVSTLLTLRRLRRRWRNHPEHGYLSRYAEMTQLSLYPFIVCGAFIPYAYFDLYFLLLATTTMLSALSRVAERAEVPSPIPEQQRWSAVAVRPRALPSRSRRRPRHVRSEE